MVQEMWKATPTYTIVFGIHTLRHRAWFSRDEYKQLYEATRQNARDVKGKSWEWAAAQLHDKILFMANTGIRPDEANWL